MSPELQELLRGTSRSFYLTLRVLPQGVRSQIGLAYLLARATDTVADTGLVPVGERLEALGVLRNRILGRRTTPVDFRRLAELQPAGASEAERRLLSRVEPAVGALRELSAEDLRDLREVLDTITSGQELDLKRFGDASEASVKALASAEELDDYTFRVAGCVGEFWTRLTRRHCIPKAPLDEARFLDDGIRLGRGLQLVNILRDIPKDLRLGRCYLPESELARVQLAPAALLDPKNEARMGPVHQAWTRKAAAHLEAGWRYTNTLPFRQFRLRLACAWPVLLGVRTLAKLGDGGFLDPGRRIKVTRSEVRALLLGSIWRLPWKASWERQFSKMSRPPGKE